MAQQKTQLEALRKSAPAMWEPASGQRLRELIAAGQGLVDAHDPAAAQILNVMGMAAFRLGDIVTADRFLRAGIAAEPADVGRAPDLWLRNNLAVALLAAGRAGEALAEVMKVADLIDDQHPVNPFLTCTLVDALWETGQRADAVVALREAAACIDVNRLGEAWRLAETYARLGEHLRAAVLVGRVIAGVRHEMGMPTEWGVGLPDADWLARHQGEVALTPTMKASVAFAMQVASAHRAAGGGSSRLADLGWIGQ